MEKNNRDGLLDKRLVNLVSKDWQTAAQVQRLSGGEMLEVAKALDRLSEKGLIDRETLEISLGVRKAGGAKLRRIRYRRKALQS